MDGNQETLTRESTIEMRKKYIGTPCPVYFKHNPLKIVRAKGQYMFDERGNRYVDCINNVCHVGHCHPAVVAAATRQMSILNTNTRFLNDNMIHLAKRLTDLLPDKLSVCFFVNSGSEANDLAIRLARKYTGKKDIVVLDDAYHGHTDLLINVSPHKFKKPCMPDKKKWVHVVDSPDIYRGKYSGEKAGQRYALLVKNAVDRAQHNDRKIAAFILESLQSCGGQRIYPPNFMRDSFKYIREVGGLCIIDEVQTGFGRVGSHMWAFQLQGADIEPDIITFGKPMGNGHPIAAVVTTLEIANKLAEGGHQYFNTYGGNPVSCAVGLAVLDIIEKEKLQENAVRVGNFLLGRLRSLGKKHKLIGDVRGVGLFLGVELVKNRQTKEPATDEACEVINRMRDKFVLLCTEGPFDNVLKIKPPMCFTEEDANVLVNTLSEVLAELKDYDSENKA